MGNEALGGAASGAAAGSSFGPWGALAGAGIGAASSLMGANKSANAASDAMSSQERMQQADLDFRRQQYQRYLGLMGPIEQQLATEARSDQPLDYERNQAQIKQNMGNTLRNINTSMGMRGMAGSGLDQGALRGAAFQQGADLSGAYSQGLQNRRNLGLTLTGRGQIGQAAQGVGQGMQGMSNLYGQQAALFNQAAAQGYQNFGQGLQGMANMAGRGYFDNLFGTKQEDKNAIPAYNNTSDGSIASMPGNIRGNVWE